MPSLAAGRGFLHGSAPPSSLARLVPSWEPLAVSLGLLPGLEALHLVLLQLSLAQLPSDLGPEGLVRGLR